MHDCIPKTLILKGKSLWKNPESSSRKKPILSIVNFSSVKAQMQWVMEDFSRALAAQIENGQLGLEARHSPKKP